MGGLRHRLLMRLGMPATTVVLPVVRSSVACVEKLC